MPQPMIRLAKEAPNTHHDPGSIQVHVRVPQTAPVSALTEPPA